MTKASDNIFARLRLSEGTAWATPASGYGVMYAKSADSLLYYKNDAGTEYTLSQTAGGGGSVVFYDEGVAAGTAAIINLVGSPGTVAVSGGTATITLTASSAPGNMWKMSKNSSSQTLTNATDTLITWEEGATIDGGGSVIDLANDRFVAPATGFYLLSVVWLWETTAPGNASAITCKVGTTEIGPRNRLPASGNADQGFHAQFALTLTTSDAVTILINPGAVTGCTARGNASQHLRTSTWLTRIT